MDWKSKRVEAILEHALLEDQALKDITTAYTIDPKLRADILRTAEKFRRALAEADQWEAKQRATEYGSHLTLQP